MAKEKKPLQRIQRFESDAAKVVHRHLSDPNHVISEEEIASVRVGFAPLAEESTQQANSRIADRKANSEKDTLPGGQKSTPWDVVA